MQIVEIKAQLCKPMSQNKFRLSTRNQSSFLLISLCLVENWPGCQVLWTDNQSSIQLPKSHERMLFDEIERKLHNSKFRYEHQRLKLIVFSNTLTSVATK